MLPEIVHEFWIKVGDRLRMNFILVIVRKINEKKDEG